MTDRPTFRGLFIRLDPYAPEHPKVAGLSDAAFRLWVEALCFARRNWTDGRFTSGQLRKLTPTPKVIVELVDAGLLTKVGRSYAIHDYTEWQVSDEDLRRRAQVRSVAGRKGAAARWSNGHRPG